MVRKYLKIEMLKSESRPISIRGVPRPSMFFITCHYFDSARLGAPTRLSCDRAGASAFNVQRK